MDTIAKDAQYVNTSFDKAIKPVVVERATGSEVCASQYPGLRQFNPNDYSASDSTRHAAG